MKLNLFLAAALLASSAAAQTTATQTTPKPAPQHSTSSAAAPAANPTAVIRTSAGNFSCVLFKDKVPHAVDNFIGLATGRKPWTDPRTHEKKTNTPLYDGTQFVRVIPNFMIQGGSPLNTMSGGPGYEIKDEFAPGLNFDQPGMLAYANSGPNTNGSQFFITEVPTPHLNPCLDQGGCDRGGQHVPYGYGYTIFGKCDPIGLVAAIARAPRNEAAGDRPTNPVKIEHIDISGAGASAATPNRRPPLPRKQ